MVLFHFAGGLLIYNNKAIWSDKVQRGKMAWGFFEEPYQKLFIFIHSVMLAIFYSIAYVLPYLSRFTSSSKTKAISDDFYKECSSQFLHTEYFEA